MNEIERNLSSQFQFIKQNNIFIHFLLLLKWLDIEIMVFNVREKQKADAITFNAFQLSNTPTTNTKSYLFRTFIAFIHENVCFNVFQFPSSSTFCHRLFLNPNPNQNNSQSIHIIALLMYLLQLTWNKFHSGSKFESC